ncbi:MAG: substrate-binding domain-containing protein, partial [Opitutales bacterium]
MNLCRCFPLFLFSCALALPALTAAERSYTIAVIPMGTTHEYWKLIHAGALKAQAELQAQGVAVEIIWKGPLREDDRDQQVQVVENFIGRRVDGMVLAPLDYRALAAPVEAAAKAGIPVAIVDSRLQSSAPVSYIATDNYAGGKLAAAVTNAGGLGLVGSGYANADAVRKELSEAGNTRVGVGFILWALSRTPRCWMWHSMPGRRRSCCRSATLRRSPAGSGKRVAKSSVRCRRSRRPGRPPP